LGAAPFFAFEKKGAGFDFPIPIHIYKSTGKTSLVGRGFSRDINQTA